MRFCAIIDFILLATINEFEQFFKCARDSRALKRALQILNSLVQFF
jgi:hypothetical protein